MKEEQTVTKKKNKGANTETVAVEIETAAARTEFTVSGTEGLASKKKPQKSAQQMEKTGSISVPSFRIHTVVWERIFLKFEITETLPKTQITSDFRQAVQFFFMEIPARKQEFPLEGLLVNRISSTLIPLTYDECLENYKEESINEEAGENPKDGAYENPVDGVDKNLKDATGQRVYRFSLNMAAAQGRSFLENGKWRFCAQVGDRIFPVSIGFSDAYAVENWSRVFPYGQDQYSYQVFFTVQELTQEHIELILSSQFMHVNRKWKKRKYVQEAATKKGKLKRVYMYLVIVLIRCFYFVFSRLTPKKGNKVLFMSETHDYLWGNLKAIHDRMIERGLDQQFLITVTCRKSVGTKKSIGSWIKTVYKIAASDFIFIDDYAPVFGFFQLYQKTTLVQVWHAGEGFKSVGYSRFGKDGSPFPSKSCHKSYTYALTGAPNLIKVYEEVFGIEKEAFLPVGMPRLDGFLDPGHMEEVREKIYCLYPILKGKQVLLFAPTYRGTGQKDAYYDYSQLDFDRIYDYCSEDRIFLMKMHPFVKEAPPIPQGYEDRIVDLSTYPDINELYYVSDLLITDYSSDYYEFSLLKKPILFFTYDRQFYELTRGVHRSVLQYAPGKVCDCFDELMNALETKDYEMEKTLAFVEENFGSYDGHASDRVIDILLLHKEVTL